MIKRTLKVANLSWNYRLAFINHFCPTEEEIIHTFRVKESDLLLARQMESSGNLVPDRHIDVERVGNIFKNPSEEIVITFKAPSKQKRQQKKRGRKGKKIVEAFKYVPLIPVNAYNFTEQYGISLPVLRQAKRFDSFTELGRVYS